MADRHFMAIQRLLMQSEPSKGALADLARSLEENRASPMQVGFEAEARGQRAPERRQRVLILGPLPQPPMAQNPQSASA